jgi:hypothetical protein
VIAVTEQRPLIFDNDAIGFYVTSSDHDLLLQIRKHLQRNGHISISDTAGRLHYIVDGTRGTPYVTRKILETTERHHHGQDEQLKLKARLLPGIVEQVLEQNGIRSELKGRAFLNQMLQVAALACSLPHKKWPDTLGTGNSARISFLYAEVQRELRRLIAGS